MADRHCITCGKEVYQSAIENDNRWYHREGSTTLCYPKVYAKPDHLFAEDFPGQFLQWKFIQSDPAMAIFTRDMIDKVTTKAIEELETHTHAAHPDLLRRVEVLEENRAAKIMTLESRLEDAETRIMELEGYPIRTSPALEILRIEERVKTLERIAGDYSKAIGRLNQRIDSAWTAFRNHRRSKRAHGI